jgi:hypothetical protein
MNASSVVFQLVVILVGVMPIATGCAHSGIPLVEVEGVVTFDGGAPPAPGRVTFQPLEIDANYPKRPATGAFGIDGAYSVHAFPNESGVIPGRYRVQVSCFSGAPDPNSADPWGDVNYIADQYKPTEMAVVADGGAITHDIDVPRRKARN